jgi:type IV pilus assembly protein PilB
MDPLSDALVKGGIIAEAALNEIRGRVKGKSAVLEMLSVMKVEEERLALIFTDRFRVPRAQLGTIQPEALTGFSEKMAVKYCCVPFERDRKSLKVAMADPLDINALQDIGFVTGCSVVPHVATKTEIHDAIRNCYEVSAEIENVLDNIQLDARDLIEVVDEEGTSALTSQVFQSGGRKDLMDDSTLSAPAIKLVTILIRDAARRRVSDIHIEPAQNKSEVRFRVDGVLMPHMEIPKWLHPAVVSRIKIMSHLDISNRKTPQDGSIKIKLEGKSVDLRVSTLPTHQGEKVAIRLLTSDEKGRGLDDTGLTEQEYLLLEKSFRQPQGMMLVTGPTGSGKSTTLHGILTKLNTGGKNIITVEDPVEYELKGITQIQVHEKSGLTFANTLRAILRQDPDIVMVGEVRDLETAEIAFRASMTGHLVLSTLHTNDTASSVTRLYDIGVEPFLVSSSLLSVVAQRLLRVVCSSCGSPYQPDTGTLGMFPDIRRDATFMRGSGCAKCNNTGYAGRTGVYEILDITPEVRELISCKASENEIRSAARRGGMRTLYEESMEKVYRGITTLDEVLRVIAIDETAEKTCTVCGRSFRGVKCPHCSDGGISCLKCGGSLEYDWMFCPRCGLRRQTENTAQVSPYKVLVVDDELGILKMIEVALRPLGLDIHNAQNGREALEKALTIKPDLVITDVNMPVMDGYGLIKQLRSGLTTMFIPVMILSSRDTAADKMRGFTFGTDDYLTKPFDYAELQARVKRLLQRTYDAGRPGQS